jgi:RimJ/RimL family protein N-acetyltransferase
MLDARIENKKKENTVISFERDGENHLNVIIETKRLHLESVKKEDTDNYVNLFAKPNNRAKFADGQPLAPEKTAVAVTNWVARWEDNNPFSSFAVSQKEQEVFIGHVVLGYGSKRGVSELAYIFDDSYWGKGYGKESVTAVVQEYAPILNKKYNLKYTNKESKAVEWETFNAIEATARNDNPASIKILESVGLKKISEEVKFGHNRYNFFATIKEIEQIPQKDENVKLGLTMINT